MQRSPRHITLEQIRIPEPCHVDLDAMPGNGRVRFCTDCEKSVYDLSSLSREEAEALVNGGGSLCVQYRQDAAGKVLTTEPSARPLRWARRLGRAALWLLTLGLLTPAGCVQRTAGITAGKMPTLSTPYTYTPTTRAAGAIGPDSTPALIRGELSAPARVQ